MKGTPIYMLCSEADFGTRSISQSYARQFQPDSILRFENGFKKMGLRGWLKGACFIRKQQTGTLLCLFNAPILIAAIFRKKKSGIRSVGVLDWTESYPSLKKTRLTKLYDKLYVWAFSRLDDVFSPAEGFRDYYNSLGANIKSCYYPLPKEGALPTSIQTHNPVKVLFIGADYRRKGGDVLLEEWKKSSLKNATLTFVCPQPPNEVIPGVNYLNHIKAGTKEHKSLFEEHDILILPSISEPFGYVLLEAINSSMCTVTTEAVGAADIVKSSGGIVAPDSTTACQEVIRLMSVCDEIYHRRLLCSKYITTYQLLSLEIL